ncbi:hypothetical protein F5878DRAFT_656922 [Lentinula raphanica]|uniref:Uncharacterized protein n=1 Tax=Lentinula raphanica TaxID=153919 RepID=A0AA38PIB4_9AGAR|nr:hypothetical protein F5878DRAFT_656922 [Lentinula raphanica]
MAIWSSHPPSPSISHSLQLPIQTIISLGNFAAPQCLYGVLAKGGSYYLVAQMEKVAWHIVLFSLSTVLIYTISPYSSPGLAPPSLLQVPLCLPTPPTTLPLPLLYSFPFPSDYAWSSPLIPKCCINNGLRYSQWMDHTFVYSSEGNAIVSWLLLFDSAPPPPPPPQHYKRWLDKIWQQYVPHQHQQQPSSSSSSSSSPLTVTLEKTYIDHIDGDDEYRHQAPGMTSYANILFHNQFPIVYPSFLSTRRCLDATAIVRTPVGSLDPVLTDTANDLKEDLAPPSLRDKSFPNGCFRKEKTWLRALGVRYLSTYYA